MDLSPEERGKIYEEEKERIEAEKRQNITVPDTTTGLQPNIAGLLCYLAGWITGIIFVVIEQKSLWCTHHSQRSANLDTPCWRVFWYGYFYHWLGSLDSADGKSLPGGVV